MDEEPDLFDKLEAFLNTEEAIAASWLNSPCGPNKESSKTQTI
mgnify:CR=1 FL=1